MIVIILSLYSWLCVQPSLWLQLRVLQVFFTNSDDLFMIMIITVITIIMITITVTTITTIVTMMMTRHGVCSCSRGTERKEKNNGEIHCIVVKIIMITMVMIMKFEELGSTWPFGPLDPSTLRTCIREAFFAQMDEFSENFRRGLDGGSFPI